MDGSGAYESERLTAPIVADTGQCYLLGCAMWVSYL